MSLMFPLLILILTIVIDVLCLMLLKPDIQYSKFLAVGNVGLAVFSSTTILLTEFNLASSVLFLVTAFRVIAQSRIAVNRMNTKELMSRSKRTFVWLDLTTLILILLILFPIDIHIITTTLLVSLLGSVVLFIYTVKSLSKWSKKPLINSEIINLPTVSICIPARNETQDLPECIESILSTTYQKLEILVLDDCSHDKTPSIIKEYAHQGVRFISGKEPDDKWIAKNSAMNKLFDESRGDIVVFAGVDVRFNSNTVVEIVRYFESQKLDMISVLPYRDLNSEYSVFIQPLRYWWELAVPKIFGHRPPALSTLWAIRRSKLKKIGDFESVKRSIRPEVHFAKRLKDTYMFVLSGRELGVSSVKKPREQFDTALRVRYPQVNKRPESVLALILIEVIVFVTPLFGIIYSLIESSNQYLLLSVLPITLLLIINIKISSLAVSKSWIIGLISLPILVIEDLYILIRSMIAYEFGEVFWKERNICLPMLQVEKELPKL